MKIAISGSAGIGKTTLGTALAERLDLTFIEENYQPLFQPGVFKGPADQLARAFVQVLEHKRQLEQEAGDFITDRCPIDLFHLWLVQGLSINKDLTRAFFKRCISKVADYDFVVLPPWGSIPLTQIENPEDQKRRIPDTWVQLRNHATINGYAHLWVPPEKILTIPQAMAEHGERVEFVLSQINTPAR